MKRLERMNRTVLSPLDKKEDESEQAQKSETLVEHLTELRKQLIKSAFVFLFFLIVVFITMNKWFPIVTRGNELVVFGPFQVIKFYTSVSVTLALGLSLPFLILIFELPIVALFLAAIGVLTSKTMKQVRRWSYLVIAVLSALLTPPDFVSQLLVLIPMVLLYEASIYIVKRIENRQMEERSAVITSD